MSLKQLLSADYDLLFDWYDWYDSDYSITEAIYAYSQDVVVQWPIREGDPELSGDNLTVVLSTLNYNWNYQGNRDVELVVQVKSDDDFQNGTVKVAIAYAGGLSDNEDLTSAVESAVEVRRRYLVECGSATRRTIHRY